jgi:hypothetical protein
MSYRFDRSPIISVIILGIIAGGCRTSYVISRTELQKLDGFEAGDEVILGADDGRFFDFTEGDRLIFTFADGPEVALSYTGIRIDGNTFHGVLPDGAEIHLDIDSLASVEVSEYSGDTTATLASVILFGGLVLGVAFLFILLITLSAPRNH